MTAGDLPHWCKEISPLRSAFVEMTRGVPAATVISSEGTCRYGVDENRFDDTLSREISCLHALLTMEE